MAFLPRQENKLSSSVETNPPILLDTIMNISLKKIHIK